MVLWYQRSSTVEAPYRIPWMMRKSGLASAVVLSLPLSTLKDSRHSVRPLGVSTLRPITQSWASLSVLRAHSPEADLASLRRRTVPRTATEGTAARKFVMLDLTPRRDPGVSTSDIPFSLAAYFQSGSDSIARPKMAL